MDKDKGSDFQHFTKFYQLLCCRSKGRETIIISHTIIVHDSDIDRVWCLKLYVGATHCQTEAKKLGLSSFKDVIVDYSHMATLGAAHREGGSQLLSNRKLVKVVKYGLVCGWEGQPN